MDKKIYLIQNTTTGQALVRAFTEVDKAAEYAKHVSMGAENDRTVFSIVKWDEVAERGRGVALVYRGVVFTPLPGDEPLH